MKKEMKEKSKSMFGGKEEMAEHNEPEMSHEEHAEGETEHPEMDATGVPMHEEAPMHPALAMAMNKLTEPDEEEPLMPHKVGGIKKFKK